jgi:hypothetical protein
MAIPDLERPRAKQVLNDIFRSFATQTTYELVGAEPCVGISSRTFANNRRDKIFPLVAMPEWESQRKERDAFMSEWLVMLGLRKPLTKFDLKMELAPPHLEIGTHGRKGVDLIASKTRPENRKSLPVFAINVKLQQLKDNQRAEVYKYDHVLGCPAIELSLGDFSIQTRRSGEVTFVPWLRQVAAPNLTNSGHIPGFHRWQRYLFQKVAGTISHYMVKTDDYLHGGYKPSENERHLFPQERGEFRRFYDNLSSTYLVFEKLCDMKNISGM